MSNTMKTIDEILDWRQRAELELHTMLPGVHPHSSRLIREEAIAIRDKHKAKAKQAILALMAERERKLLDFVLGEDEVFLDISIVDNTGRTIDRVLGTSYTPYMVARNNLRAEQRRRAELTAQSPTNKEEL